MNKLKGYRVMLGLSQGDMAEKLNISKQSYYKKENGYTPFARDEMLAIRDMFSGIRSSITIDEIFFD